MKAKTYDIHLYSLNLVEMYPSKYTLKQGDIFKNRLYIKEQIEYSFYIIMHTTTLILLRNMKI